MIKILFFSIFVFCLSAQSTYKVGDTEYYYGRYYVTTGKPMVKRSYANKEIFLNTLGLEDTPEGYEIDHIIPLFMGGSDSPENMQLLTFKEHKIKTAKERSPYRRKYYIINNRGYFKRPYTKKR